MFKFTLRDILWLALFVGFCLHAWIDRSARHSAYVQRVREETAERVAAEDRARLAEKKAAIDRQRADRFAALARYLQSRAIMRELETAKIEEASTYSR